MSALQDDPDYSPSALGALGYKLFRLEPRRKKPLANGWQDEATDDPTELARLASHASVCGFGVRCEGLLVIDVDMKHGNNGAATLAALEAEHGPLPETMRVATADYGSGPGFHAYFRSGDHEVLSNNKGKLGPGLDVKTNGGNYVVAPGSLVFDPENPDPAGHDYPVLGDGRVWPFEALPLVPDWVVERLATGAGGRPATATAGRRAGMTLEEARAGMGVPGTRNDSGTSLVGHHARRHRDDETAYIEACVEDYEQYADRDGYPLSEFMRTVESVWTAEQAKPEVVVPEVWHDGRPTIDVTEREPIEVAAEAWAAVEVANDPPSKFRSGGIPVRVEHDDDEQPTLSPLTSARMKYEASTVAAFVRVQKDGRLVVTGAPTEAVSMMLANPGPPLPVLTRVVAAPVFGRNEELQTAPGYHAGSRTLYAPTPGFEVDPVAEAPSSQEIEWAVGVMRDLLCDFPFVSDADLAHALALWLLPFARDLIDGPTPMHLFDKPAPGTGAGLLAEVLMIPALGTALPSMGECRDDDEYRKRLTAKFMAGAQVMMFDNLEGQLRSPVLAAALTQRVWEDRILGASQIGKWPIRAVWIATANNLQMNRDLSRRCIRIRLDAAEERPWERTGFTHQLPSHAYSVRGDAVWAALTLIRGWLAAGRPAWSGKPLGSYEDWSATVGGVLEHAGVDGFLDREAMASMYEDADTESADIAWLVELWWSRFQERATKTADLRKAIYESGGCPVDLGYGEQTQTIRLGVYLRKLNGRRVTLDNGRVVTIEKGGKSSSSRWKLTEVGREPEPVQQGLGL